MTDDGKALTCVSHPVAPWWYRLWGLVFRRNIRGGALETVEIEVEPRGGRRCALNGVDQ